MNTLETNKSLADKAGIEVYPVTDVTDKKSVIMWELEDSQYFQENDLCPDEWNPKEYPSQLFMVIEALDLKMQFDVNQNGAWAAYLNENDKWVWTDGKTDGKTLHEALYQAVVNYVSS